MCTLHDSDALISEDPVASYRSLLSYTSHGTGMPVVKLGTDGRILYANRASFPVLSDLSFSMMKKLPASFRRGHPCLTDPDAFDTITFETERFLTKMYVIGFPEAGYIGLYAYEHVERDKPDARQQQVRGTLAE